MALKICFMIENEKVVAVAPLWNDNYGMFAVYSLEYASSALKEISYLYNLEEATLYNLEQKIALYNKLKSHWTNVDIEIISKDTLFNYGKYLLEVKALENLAFEYFELKDMEKCTSTLKEYAYKCDMLHYINDVHIPEETMAILNKKPVFRPRYQSSPLCEVFCNYMDQICLEYSHSYSR